MQWRLGNFDCSRPITDSTNLVLTAKNHPLFRHGFCPPYYFEKSVAVDKWGFGMLMKWTYSSIPNNQPVALNSASPMPEIRNELKTFIRELLEAKNDKNSIKETAEKLGIFEESTLIEVMLFFEEIQLKTSDQKTKFFTSLPTKLSEVNIEVQYKNILELINQQLKYKSFTDLLFKCVITIGENIKNMIPKEEQAAIFEANLTPVILNFCNIQNPSTKILLFNHFEMFQNYLTENDLMSMHNSVITALNSPNVLCREAVVKMLVHYLPKVKSSNAALILNNLVTLLKKEPEGSLRTNIVVCFAKLIDPLFKSHEKIFQNGLYFALKDSFVPCRTAAVQAIGGILWDGKQIIREVIPNILPLCLDIHTQEIVFECLERLLFLAKSEILKNSLLVKSQSCVKDIVKSKISFDEKELSAQDILNMESDEFNCTFLNTVTSPNEKKEISNLLLADVFGTVNSENKAMLENNFWSTLEVSESSERTQDALENIISRQKDRKNQDLLFDNLFKI